MRHISMLQLREANNSFGKGLHALKAHVLLKVLNLASRTLRSLYGERLCSCKWSKAGRIGTEEAEKVYLVRFIADLPLRLVD